MGKRFLGVTVVTAHVHPQYVLLMTFDPGECPPGTGRPHLSTWRGWQSVHPAGHQGLTFSYWPALGKKRAVCSHSPASPVGMWCNLMPQIHTQIYSQHVWVVHAVHILYVYTLICREGCWMLNDCFLHWFFFFYTHLCLFPILVYIVLRYLSYT